MKNLHTYILGSILIFNLTACGPSKEEIEAREKAKADSIVLIEKNNTDSIKTILVKSADPTYYSASEFGLRPGKVICYSPNSDWISAHSDRGMVSEQIYIHIQFGDGLVMVYPIDYKTWLILGDNAILK